MFIESKSSWDLVIDVTSLEIEQEIEFWGKFFYIILPEIFLLHKLSL